MTTKILVAIDFTPCSDSAFAEAIALAKRLGAELDLVHIVAPPPSTPDTRVSEQRVLDGVLAGARAQLAALIDKARAAGVAAHKAIGVGHPVHGLLDFIEHLQPAFVIAGSHGRGPIGRALLGSVSTALVQKSHVPVMVVPRAQERRRSSAPRAWACADCGRLLGPTDSRERCEGCGKQPVRWLSAPIEKGPADALAPSVADAEPSLLSYERTNDPAGLFATSVGGTEGYDVNPELRVRY